MEATQSMEIFADYLNTIPSPENRARMREVLAWVMATFPVLVPRVAWNQPMFTHHGTFIIGFSAAKHHFAVAPERAGMERFSEDIVRAGYRQTQQLIQMRWEQPVDKALLTQIIAFNIADKADCHTFWRA